MQLVAIDISPMQEVIARRAEAAKMSVTDYLMHLINLGLDADRAKSEDHIRIKK